jgi:hypothetical protein
MTDLVGVAESDYHHQNWTSPPPAASRSRWTGSTPDLSQEVDQTQGAGHQFNGGTPATATLGGSPILITSTYLVRVP